MSEKRAGGTRLRRSAEGGERSRQRCTEAKHRSPSHRAREPINGCRRESRDDRRCARQCAPAGRSGGESGTHPAVPSRRCVARPFWLSRSSPSPPRSLPRCANACRAQRAATAMPRAPVRVARAGLVRAAVLGRSQRAARRPGRRTTVRTAVCIPLRRFSASPLRRRSRRPWSQRLSFHSPPATPLSPVAAANGRRRPCGPAPRRRPFRVRPARRRSRSEAPVLRLELQP